ncbi:AAEL003131-PA [Aedes aegypti]|uniref:AAEL003131-PA n=1 Tax=Aedes aegypti TaxID=7159 RepID=Q17GB3_AEDAE|nr:AAEL003131-PA [Aedes aegypti]
MQIGWIGNGCEMGSAVSITRSASSEVDKVYTSVHITNLDVPRTYILEREEFLNAFSVGHRHPLVHIESESDDDDSSSSSSSTATPTIAYTNYTATSNISSNSNEGKSFHEIKPLIMDCQYEIKANECGFVLKWYFNRKLIYQWIPARNPVGMNQFKSELRTNYSMSDLANYKYRALVIQNPKLNHSGEYMCSVQTYESFDRKAARFQIVVPEKRLLLHYENDAEKENMLLIKCSVFMIYPEPNLVLVVSGDLLLVSSRTVVVSDRHRMYNKTIYGLIDKHLLISPTSIGCVLTVSGSSYVRKRETIYYGKLIRTAISPHLQHYTY